MSRHPHVFRSLSLAVRAARLTTLVVALCLCLPARVPAGVIYIDVNSYRLDGGPRISGPWEIAEKLAVAHDVAIIVMDSKATQTMIQGMLQLLETLKIPTLLTKEADYKALVDRGVIRPTTTP
jgi:hypothetical protein